MKLSTEVTAIVTAVVAAAGVIAAAGELSVRSIAAAIIAGLGALTQVKPKAQE